MKEVICMQEKPAVFIYGKVRQPPELAHYGIRGQKWGLRRFQNEDGSYTAEGKERYGRGSWDGRAGKLVRGKKDPNARENWKVKDLSKLSDEDLRKRNNRLQAEQNYKNNLTPQWKKTAKNWGSEAVKAILVTSVTTIIANSLKNKLEPGIKKNVNKLFKDTSKIALSALKTSKNKTASYLAALLMRHEVNKR